MQRKRERERNRLSQGLFVPQEDEPESSTRGAYATSSSGPYAGLPLPEKRERIQSREVVFVTQDHESESSTRACTTVSSGPYAGLQSAKKRKRESVDMEEEKPKSFGPAKKAGRKGRVLKDV